MASYVPQGYVQSSYNMQQRTDRLYAPSIAVDYIPLNEDKIQKGYFGIEQDNFLKIPEVMRKETGEFFTELVLSQSVRENPAKNSYEVRVYQPQRREEKREVDDIDKEVLSELIERELEKFRRVNVQHV